MLDSPLYVNRPQDEIETRELEPVTPPGGRRLGPLAAVVALCAVCGAIGYLLGRHSARPRPARRTAARAEPSTPTSARRDEAGSSVRLWEPAEKTPAEPARSRAVDGGGSRLPEIRGGQKAMRQTPPIPRERVAHSHRARGFRAEAGRPAYRTVFRFRRTRRVTYGLITLYGFEEGKGTTVTDLCRRGGRLNLAVRDRRAVSWVPGGLRIRVPSIVASADPARKLADACRITNAITVEAWLKPASAAQRGPAPIVSLSSDPLHRNFTLGQERELYNIRLRTSVTGEGGANPSLTTGPCVTDELSHVICTRDAKGALRIYVDGVIRAAHTLGGEFRTWDEDMRLVLANDPTLGRPWLGEIHLVAIYSRALSPDEVTQNYQAGPEGKTPRRAE